MGRPGFYDAKGKMREVLAGQIERFLAAQTMEARASAVNGLSAVAAYWTRRDKAYQRELAGIIDSYHIGTGQPWPDEARYAMVQAITCCLARQGMLDTIDVPTDEVGMHFVEEPG